jgi:hypothetical protein
VYRDERGNQKASHLITKFILTIVLLLPLATPHRWSGASGEELSLSSKYNLPQFLQGRVTVDTYRNWLLVKARSLHSRDLKKKRPYAKHGSWTDYRQAIHEAVVRAGEFDPFTGAALQWELISTWDDKSAKDSGQQYIKRFYLLPTVDHTDPATFGFEICSFIVNSAKNRLTPEEFVDLCGKIVRNRSHGQDTTAHDSIPAELKFGPGQVKYVVPPFLKDVVSHKEYSHWLLKKAARLWQIDRQEKRPFVTTASQELYKEKLQAAICAAGLCDPYTGDTLRWDLIGTWDPDMAKDSVLMPHYLLLPTADHTDPAMLDFEICSWLVNMCKSHLSANQFVDLCKTVTDFRMKK